MGTPRRLAFAAAAARRARVLDRFHIEKEQRDAFVLEHRLGEVGDRDVGFVAGRMDMAHAQALLHRERVDRLRVGAALAHDRERAVARLGLVEDGGEVRHHAGGEIGESLAVGPDEPHPGAPRRVDERVLNPQPLRPGFAEAGGHHHGDLHARRRAGLHRPHRVLARHGDDRELGRLRQVLEPREGAQALHRAARPGSPGRWRRGSRSAAGRGSAARRPCADCRRRR